MEILRDASQLIGKEIAFAHAPKFGEKILIATTNGEVILFTFENIDEYEAVGIETLSIPQVTKFLESPSAEFERTALARIGVFDLDEYKRQMAERRKKNEESRQKRIAANELETLKKLTRKYPDEAKRLQE